MEDSKTTIAPDVLTTIARLTALKVEGVSRMCLEPAGISRIFHRRMNEGVHVEIENDIVYADLYVILKHGINIREVSRNIQQQVARAISEMVGMQVGRLNIHIEDIDYPGETEA